MDRPSWFLIWCIKFLKFSYSSHNFFCPHTFGTKSCIPQYWILNFEYRKNLKYSDSVNSKIARYEVLLESKYFFKLWSPILDRPSWFLIWFIKFLKFSYSSDNFFVYTLLPRKVVFRYTAMRLSLDLRLNLRVKIKKKTEKERGREGGDVCVYAGRTFEGLWGSLVCRALSDWLRRLFVSASTSAGVVGSFSKTSSSSSSAGVIGSGAGPAIASSAGLTIVSGIGGALSGGLSADGGGLTSDWSRTVVCQE